MRRLGDVFKGTKKIQSNAIRERVIRESKSHGYLSLDGHFCNPLQGISSLIGVPIKVVSVHVHYIG